MLVNSVELDGGVTRQNTVVYRRTTGEHHEHVVIAYKRMFSDNFEKGDGDGH